MNENQTTDPTKNQFIFRYLNVIPVSIGPSETTAPYLILSVTVSVANDNNNQYKILHYPKCSGVDKCSCFTKMKMSFFFFSNQRHRTFFNWYAMHRSMCVCGRNSNFNVKKENSTEICENCLKTQNICRFPYCLSFIMVD